ncbi:hypothetical protein BS47DRAFT_1400029 [Hydnum rufescens UP504]|uniref:Uncharacterized protein n=1 Tax=Hydnum rufescens UP504 TaxID=1448309 RepID=A0A9P6DLH8_9AGAM|nr:hypothetical protein BS47DRAFT_1400029 [Hydnum rufescens UP504]
MAYRAPNPFASLVEYHPRRGSDDVPPSPNDSLDESSRRSYSPSLYSKADNISEFRFQPDGELEKENPGSYVTMDPEDDIVPTRLSVMGPRMKLLSRAPWEDGAEDEIREEDEIIDDGVDNVSVHDKHSRERSHTVTKLPEEARGWKGFGLSASKPKDTVPPLRLRSITSPISIPAVPESTVSLDGRQSSSQKQPTSRLALTRPRTISSNSTISRTHSLASSFASSSGKRARKVRDKSPAPTSSSNRHPYANPEIYSGTNPFPYPSPHSANHFHARQNQQFDTLTADSTYPRSESSTTIKSSPATNAFAPSGLHTSLATASTPAIVPASSKQSLFAPSTPVVDAGDVDGVPAGMLGFPGSPAYNLITLEEAREKVRERSKGGTVALHINPAVPKFNETVSSHANSRPAEQYNGNVYPPVPNDPSPLMSMPPSSNTQTVEGDSPPLPSVPGAKTLKPKRSGFLKFFKDAKEKDRDPSGAGSEPVPAIPRSYSNDSSSTHQSNEISSSAVSFPPPTPSVPQYHADSKEGTNQPGTRPTISRSHTSSFASQGPTVPTGVTKSDRIEPKLKKSPKLGSKAARAAKLEALNAKSRESAFESLQIRPVSSFFSSGLPMDLLSSPGRTPGLGITIQEGTPLESHDFAQGTSSHSLSVSSNSTLSIPSTPASDQPLPLPHSGRSFAQLTEARKAWRLQAWEYEAQIRELQAEVAMLRGVECKKCGAAPSPPPVPRIPNTSGVLDRPRRKTGVGSMFASGWEGAA